MNAKILLALVLALPLAGMADEPSMDLQQIGEAIRDGKLDVGDEYSLDENQGRLHTIHADYIGMECSSCHHGKVYPVDYLLVGKEKPLSTRTEGRYDRAVCLGCHGVGGSATTFYGTATQDE